MPLEAQKKNAAPAETPLEIFCRRAVLALLGACIPVLALFFSVSTFDQFELPKQVALRTLTALMLFFWGLRLASTRKWEWRSTPLDLPLAAWSLWLLVKTFHSVSPSISWRGEYENFAGSLTQCNYSLLYFIATQHLRSFRQVERMLQTLVMASVAVAVYGLFQALGLDFISWSAGSVIRDRYFASLGNPNFLGGLMIMAMPVTASFYFSKTVLRERRGLFLFWLVQAGALALWMLMYLYFPPEHSLDLGALGGQAGRWVFWVMVAELASVAAQALLLVGKRLGLARNLALGSALLVMFKALLDTGTRGAFLGLLAAGLAFAALRVGQALWANPAAPSPALEKVGRPIGKLVLVCLALVALLAGASFAMGPALSRRMVESISHPWMAADRSRLQIWGPALKIWKAYPLTGSGVDTFKTVFPHFSSSKFADYDGANVSSRMAHCEPLQVLATMGLIGLAAWTWLLVAWARAWWRRLRRQADGQNTLLLQAVGALWIAYLVQNLVSFGVAAISVPFWIAMSFAWAGDHDLPSAWTPPAWLRQGLGAFVVVGLVPALALATSTYRADKLYNQGHILSSQAQSLGQYDADSLRRLAAYCLNNLNADPAPDSFVQRQVSQASDRAAQLETAVSRGYRDPQAVKPDSERLARESLYLSAAAAQEKATQSGLWAALGDGCPGEVKYHVYLGLAYEELLKTGESAAEREAWFQLARNSYQRGTELNPQNAYYSGNLGRLWGMKSEMGDPDAMAKAEQYYQQAIHLAPVTALFYQNLMQLYDFSGQPEKSVEVARSVEERDPRLAGYLYFQGGGMLLEMARNPETLKNKVQDQKLLALAQAGLLKASSLRPDLAEVPYSLSLDYLWMGDKTASKAWLEKCLQADPQNAMALKLKADQGW